MFHSQKGWTLLELVMALIAIEGIAIMGLVLYAVFHFVVKFW